jgi:carbon-monoxide dehydrogenase medium subunit
MTPFELLEPRTLREAAALLEAGGDSARPVGGGVAVMLMMKMGVLRPARLVSLAAVEPRYAEIALDDAGHLRLGALATLRAIERSPLVQAQVPVLARALRRLSNVRVRNVATLGGHLAHADPHMDLPPVLVALGAQVRVVGPGGERLLPLAGFHTGYLETVLGRGELIAEVICPVQGARRATYLKCTTRAADDWPALGLAAVLSVDGDTIREACLVASAATDVPTRLAQAEAVLLGARPDDARLARAGEAAAAETTLIGDEHGSAAYKRELLQVCVGRAVRAALAGA